MRKLGRDGPEVFPVGLGGMPMSIAGRPDEKQSVATIHAALDARMTLIDTANVYCLDDNDIGHNERLIAKALKEWRGDRSRVVVATKGGLSRPKGRWERDGRPAFLKESCGKSLKALGVDRIDLYQLHAFDVKVPLEETAGTLKELQAAGKARWIGLSNVSVDEIRRARKIVQVATVQNRFNPFFREAEADGVLKYCEGEGIGFLAYSPLGGGRLNKKLPAHPAAQAVARRHGVTPHQLILAWVLAKSPAAIPIPGASRPENARASAGAASIDLPAADIAEIDRAPFSRE